MVNQVAVYTRVSTGAQEENGSSLDTQEAACCQYAKDRQWKVVAIYREVHSGGQLWERPRLTELRESIRRHELDGVVVYATDRLSRDAVHLGVVLCEADHHRCQIEFVTEPLDTSPEGQLLRSVRGYVAQVERAKIVERTMRGKVAKVRSGKVLGIGNVRYGYQWVYEVVGGRPVKVAMRDDPATAWVVRRIFRDVAAGVSLNQIRAQLEAEGVPPPRGGRQWWESAICRFIADPAYSGRAVAFKERPEAERIQLPPEVVPPLVSEAEQAAAQARLAYNKLSAVRCSASPQAFLLRAGFVRCGNCGTPMAAITQRLHGQVAYIYSCKNSTGVNRCTKRPAITAHLIDGEVWERATQLLTHPELVLAEVAKRAQETTGQTDLEAAIATAQERSATLDRQRRNLVANLGLLDTDSAAVVRDQLAKLSAQYRRVEEEQEALQAKQSDVRANLTRLDDAIDWCKTVAANLATATYDQKRLTLLALNFKVTVWDTGHHPRFEITGAVTPGDANPICSNAVYNAQGVFLRWVG